MSRHNVLAFTCLTAGLSLLARSPLAIAQPHFSFGAASNADLTAEVFATDYVDQPASDTQTACGLASPLQYSGGVADWGSTISIHVEDGEIVAASSNPLVRLDGDGTQQVRVAWKAWSLLDSNFWDPDQGYLATGLADTDATFALALTGLQPGTTYELWYYWTYEADAEEEQEYPDPPPGDDPAVADGRLELDIASGGGPGLVFDQYVDNFSGGLSYRYETGSGMVQFVAAGTSAAIWIDLSAYADSALSDPPGDDLSSCIFRGTLVLRLLAPVIIITEVVDGDLGPGNPRFVEITNCGPVDVIFDPADYLAVYFDGGTTPDVTVDLGGYALASGASLVVASSANGGDQAFVNTYGFQADICTPDPFGDGNDVYSLQHGGLVLDTYGVIGVDGATALWAYEDSYAYSRPDRFPNQGRFDIDNWVVGPYHALDAATDQERVALLRARTTPGTHRCQGVPTSAGDLDGDGDVDLGDLALLLADYGCTGGNCRGDLDGDGDTDLADLATLLSHYGA